MEGIGSVIEGNPWEKRAELGPLRALWETIKVVLLKPRKFFETLTVKESIGDPFLFYFIVCTVVFFAGLGWSWVFEKAFSVQNPQPALPVWLSVTVFFTTVVGIFISTFFNQIFVQLFKGHGNWKATFAVLCYASAVTVFSIVPFLGPLVGVVWGLIITIIGFQVLHRLSMGKAVAVYFLPSILMVIFFVMLFMISPKATSFFKGLENSGTLPQGQVQ